MEMLHGSDGWGKLVSELQQKEKDDVQQAAVQAVEQQEPAGKRRKRGRNPKDGSDPLAQGARCSLRLPFYNFAFATSSLSTIRCFISAEVQLPSCVYHHASTSREHKPFKQSVLLQAHLLVSGAGTTHGEKNK